MPCFKINFSALKKYFLQFSFLCIVSLVANSCIKPGFELYSPINKCALTNNRPDFNWQPVDCNHYEVWIDDIKMAEVPKECNSYTSFSLAFGDHEWFVKAIAENHNTISKIGKFTIDDAPLEQLPENAVLLRNNWKVKSAFEVEETGEELTYHIINTDDWASTSLPCTVLTALVRNGIYPNPYFSTNNMQIPDANDSFNTENNLLQYSHIKGENPWKEKYWFRTQFVKPIYAKGKKTFLHLNGLNYKAELWLNGELVADTIQLNGLKHDFKFNISEYDKSKNIMAVAIYPPNNVGQPLKLNERMLSPETKNINCNSKADVSKWDHQPVARDRNMGIVGDVYLSFADKIEIQDLYVTSNLQVPDTSKADVTITATILNYTPLESSGIVKAILSIDNEKIVAEQKFHIDAKGKTNIKFTPAKFKQMTLEHPKLWWPNGYGKQHLYKLELIATTDELNRTSTKSTMFGIRKVETDLNNNQRICTINGKKIELKSGNWVDEMLLNRTASLYEQEIKKSKADGLNMLRVWGSTTTPPQAFYNAADREGILICQDIFNNYQGAFKKEKAHALNEQHLAERVIDVIKKYRNHPCLIQ